MAQFPLSPFPLADSPLLPFISPSTYLAPSSCDRNRPTPSQVACKLTPFAPPFTQLTYPFQIPRTPTAPRLTMTTSGIFRLLLSGTLGIGDRETSTNFRNFQAETPSNDNMPRRVGIPRDRGQRDLHQLQELPG
jgi:hypothetical protein